MRLKLSEELAGALYPVIAAAFSRSLIFHNFACTCIVSLMYDRCSILVILSKMIVAFTIPTIIEKNNEISMITNEILS